MNNTQIKQEHTNEVLNGSKRMRKQTGADAPVIDLDESSDDGSHGRKKMRKRGDELPEGFLDPLPERSCKQFWKSGDFDGRSSAGDWSVPSGGMDHLRVHPRFLHSNATSHKWVLGAFAELLDNSLDESCNGATYVNIDMLTNKKDNSRMLLIEDNGGGMDPEKMRYCMSLGYSLKSKVKDVIGQYGNGFKTSTMRLGADVIVFSRCSGKNGKTATQSIGLLSYTFLRATGKADTIVPMLDFEKSGQEWNRIKRSLASDWDLNVETMVQWSPFASEADLLKQFHHMKDQGTRIIIYNLWEDDQGKLELDFDADDHDIQIRGVNRDERNIEMAQQYPNSRHYLTYHHSLRSYASILYLRVPHNFRMILRGKDVEHHNIVNDMMMTNMVTYRPHPSVEGIPKDSNIVAVVTMGFVKDAKAHIDVQGFNVYHKNRLIKPFWRIWNVAGSDGRGVIGVLEADFIEPAHDKQGFERTTVLQRLETRLVQMQKTYWSTYCHKIGYARKYYGKSSEGIELSPCLTAEPSTRKSKRTREPYHTPDYDYTVEPSTRKEPSPDPDYLAEPSIRISLRPRPTPQPNKFSPDKSPKEAVVTKPNKHPIATTNGDANIGEKGNISNKVSGVGANSSESASPLTRDDLQTTMNKQHANGRKTRLLTDLEVRNLGVSPTEKAVQVVVPPHLGSAAVNGNETIALDSCTPSVELLTEENRDLKERLKMREEEILGDLMQDLKSEQERCKELEAQLEEEKQKYEVLKKEQDSIVAIFLEEKERSDVELATLRKKLKEAESTNKDLTEKVTQLQLEKMRRMGHKWGK